MQDSHALETASVNAAWSAVGQRHLVAWACDALTLCQHWHADAMYETVMYGNCNE